MYDPAIYAISRYNSFVNQVYAENDIDLNMADYDSRTALHLASCFGHLEVASFLLR